MNTFRPFRFTLIPAGCLLLAMTAMPQNSKAQRPAKRAAKTAASTAHPSPSPSVIPVPTEVASSTPAPDAESEELSPPTDDPEVSDTSETDIDATQSASFSSKDRIAVFNGNVKVTDPRFQLVCDKLTVFLNKPAVAGQNAASTPPPLATPAPVTGKNGDGDSATPSGGSGIDHARAEGHVVILQKKAPTKPGEEEKISIGRGEVGTFDNKTGDMVLLGWPSLEQNGSSLIASAESTVMTIHRDSSLNTEGPCKTRLIQHGKGGASAFDLPGSPTAPTSNVRKPNGGAPPAAANAPGTRNAATATQH